MGETTTRALGLGLVVAYAALIGWLYARQPQTIAQVTGGLSAVVGAYQVNEQAFADALRFFRNGSVRRGAPRVRARRPGRARRAHAVLYRLQLLSPGMGTAVSRRSPVRRRPRRDRPGDGARAGRTAGRGRSGPGDAHRRGSEGGARGRAAARRRRISTRCACSGQENDGRPRSHHAAHRLPHRAAARRPSDRRHDGAGPAVAVPAPARHAAGSRRGPERRAGP